MATKVAGELYETLTGQLFEIGRQLRQKRGYPYDPLRLKYQLQAVIEGRIDAVTGTFELDMRKEGWTLLENSPRRISGAIDAVPFLKNGESSVKGKLMATRAVELDANYGQEDAEWLLAHQDKIPAELREFYLVFPATKWQVLQNADDDPDVPYLFWDRYGWFLGSLCLDLNLVSGGYLVRPRM
jgi:hypothetical protein